MRSWMVLLSEVHIHTFTMDSDASEVQWNLRTRDTTEPIYFVPCREVVPISETLKYEHGVETSVPCRGAVPISEVK